MGGTKDERDETKMDEGKKEGAKEGVGEGKTGGRKGSRKEGEKEVRVMRDIVKCRISTPIERLHYHHQPHALLRGLTISFALL